MLGYTCPYDTIQGTKAGRNISSIQSQAFSDRDCQELCDQRGVECWAAARDGADTCYLYQGSSPFAFDDGVETVTDSSFTMFIKRCYEGLVDENTYDWLQVTSDLPLSVCHDSDPGGRVYTLVKEAKSWGSARAHCSGIGQTLAGSRTAMDRQTIQDVIQEMYEPTYAVNGRNPHWVDITGNLSGAASWGDTGTAVSGGVAVEGTDKVQCGSMDIESGQYFLKDCSSVRTFVCLKTNVPCARAVKEGVHGTDFQDQGSKSLAECRTDCDNRRTAGLTCGAFSYRTKNTFPRVSELCYLHTSTFSSQFPPYETGAMFTLYSYTCVWAVLQEAVLMEELTTETNPTTTTAPTTPSSQPASTKTEQTTTAMEEETSPGATDSSPVDLTTSESQPSANAKPSNADVETTTVEIINTAASEPDFTTTAASPSLISSTTAAGAGTNSGEGLTSTAASEPDFTTTAASPSLISSTTAAGAGTKSGEGLTSTAASEPDFTTTAASPSLISSTTATGAGTNSGEGLTSTAASEPDFTTTAASPSLISSTTAAGAGTNSGEGLTSTAASEPDFTTTAASPSLISSTTAAGAGTNSGEGLTSTSCVGSTACSSEPQGTQAMSTTTTQPTTYSSTTTTSSSSSTTSSGRRCLCSCSFSRQQPLPSDTQDLIDELKIQKNSTYKYRMKYYSMPDSRVSATSVGLVAILSVTVVLLVIVVLDVPALVGSLRSRRGRWTR
ncbi:mucin-22-like [Littorina saxatilis]|uniref:mucin-22-like n=1 Tax=Littorina saxatilis TaxID=31220 RepID=UPI0038B62589